ncbi:nucleoside hydrolase [Arenimonas fontis]|uniref:Nucleoside hydrolase n=1 Tax=Arenimonas fontis TaxID=2608255 RepID=A0A5B2Z9D9_9GAMM|nr:nucleoside hydrolase [Arenimonas fontis]KAA2285318.1 nucleoside hydrolase [Arenimonas fontis]
MDRRIPLLIDTDPGVDDALALLMAFADPAHRVLGLTVAAGNVGLSHTLANALKLCEVAGVDVPVYPGCPVPLVHPAEDAAHVHGQDGFGDTGYAPAARLPESEHAALAIVRLAREHAGRLLLVTLGPLTNLALALRLDPELPARVARLVVMGGAVTGQGNTSVSAEFNIAFDPEAAEVVFRAFPVFELVDWEAVLRHGFPHRAFESWLAAGDHRARFYAGISARTRAWSESRRGSDWHSADALAMALALEPGAARRVEARPLAVELAGRHCRGATVVDWQRRTGLPDKVRILMDYDREAFQARLRQALGA